MLTSAPEALVRMSSRKGRRQPSRAGDSLPGSPAGACSTVRGAALLTVTGAQDKGEPAVWDAGPLGARGPTLSQGST